MKIIELIEYPVKSLPGIPVGGIEVTSRGLGQDRRYMLVNENNEFLSQRSLPELTQYQVSVTDRLAILQRGDDNRISVPIKPVGQRLKVRIWQDECSVIELNRDISNWFSKRLNQPVKLVYMQDDHIRQPDPDYSGQGDQVSFADGFPVLVTSMSSLNDLNTRLRTPIPMDRFRANIVLDGEQPFAEDYWIRIKIGEVVLRAAKPCGRCQVITTNQLTGVRDKEPLSALSEFRKVNNKVLFGVNFIPETLGTIAVADEVIAF
jgi:uncharacterized protein YcbX